MGSRGLFTLLLACMSLSRLAELRRSRRHAEDLRRRGAHEAGQGHYPWMVAVHVAWLVGCATEVWGLAPPFRPRLAGAMGALLVVALALRGWAVRTLGERWTTRVLVLPGEPLVTAGPYRWCRHPNYLAVTLEIAALPLIHGAWRTALLASVANFLVLAVRIRAEAEALRPQG